MSAQWIHARILTIAAVVCAALCIWSAGCLPSGPAALNRASELFRRGQYQEAATEYRRAMEWNPSWADPHLGLGNALWKMGQRQEALQSYRQAVSLGRDWREAHIALGDALIDSEKWAEAVPVLRRAATLAPADPVPESLLGIALTELGQNEEAVQAFESVLKRCPTCLDARSMSAYSKAKSRVAR
jgi:Flp pilus assembly protein TadD